MAETFAIIENGQPMDGEFYSRAELMLAIQYANHDATIVEFDLGELASGKTTSMRDLTEDLVAEWWHGEGINETYERIGSGRNAPGLAYRYFSDECAAYEMRVAS